MKAQGLKPLVTLNHYTLPAWLHDAAGCHADIAHCSPRGWLEPTAVAEAARYAGFVAGEFPEVELWATLNEPFTAVVLAGYLLPSDNRTNPPGVTLRWAEAKSVYRALIEAHARMVDAVRAAAPKAQVGIVYNIQAVSPKDPKKPQDVQAAKDLAYLMNEAFLNAVARGDADFGLDGKITHRDDLSGRLDFLGVNYYVRATVEGLGSPTSRPTRPSIPSTWSSRETRQESAKRSILLEVMESRSTSPRRASRTPSTPARARPGSRRRCARPAGPCRAAPMCAATSTGH